MSSNSHAYAVGAGPAAVPGQATAAACNASITRAGDTINLDSNRTDIRFIHAAAIGHDCLRNHAVGNHDHVICAGPEARGSPIDFHDLTVDAIGRANPLTGGEWTFDVDREPSKDISQGVLQGQSQHDGQYARGRQYCRDRLLKHGQTHNLKRGPGNRR